MTPSAARTAAQLLCRNWLDGNTIEDLPPECRPQNRAEGYAIQAEWPSVFGDTIAGWKIAATSEAGQKHIGVSGPIAGSIFRKKVRGYDAQVSLAGNRMRVAECEIVFRMGRRLVPRSARYGRDEVVAAIAAVHPGIEVPDSRYTRFERAGEAQLIADCACMNEMLVGEAMASDARIGELAHLELRAKVSDGREDAGRGSNALGDPVIALVWLVNELAAHGVTLESDQFVTTGTCIPPIPVLPGHRVEVDYGWLGRMRASFK